MSITQAALAAASRAGDAAAERDRMGLVAHAYAALGLPVLPLWHRLMDGTCACGAAAHVPGGTQAREIAKHPRCNGGSGKASTDRRQIQSWWWRWPSAGIGLATGRVIDVIDVDDPGALDGVADLLAAGRLPEPVAYARTGRAGGVHIVVGSSGLSNAQAVIPGVDVRGKGGYIVAAPTVHRTGTAYAWGPMGLPTGDADAGRGLPALPWERETTSEAGTREQAWAAARLSGQARKVASATEGGRNRAILSAGVAMGAVVHAGWIGDRVTRQSILAAAASAGADGTDSERTLDRALAIGARGTLPVLEERDEASVDEVIAGVRLWMTSGAGRAAVGGRAWGSAEAVLSWVLAEAGRTGRREVVAAVRQVEEGCGVGREAGAKALARLMAAGVLSRVERGTSRGTTGAVYRVLAVAKSDTDSAQPGTTYGGVSDFATGPTVPSSAAITAAALAHDVRGHARGLGRGITATDRRLLVALPADGSTLNRSAWAAAAGCHPVTTRKATAPGERGSLAALGLVAVAGPGQVAATAQGCLIIRSLTGADDLGALDALAEALAVTGRAQVRSDRIARERDAHALGLLPAVVEDAVRGREGALRDTFLSARGLGAEGHGSLTKLLWLLDESEGARGLRRSVVGALSALADRREASSEDRESVSASALDVWALGGVAAGLLLAGVGPSVDTTTGEILDDVRRAQVTVEAVFRLIGLRGIREMAMIAANRGSWMDGCPDGYRPLGSVGLRPTGPPPSRRQSVAA